MSLNYCYFLIFDDQRHAKVSKKSVKSNVFFYFFSYLCNKIANDSILRRRTMSDVHSLGYWRINGSFPHIDAWYDTFGVKEGNKMYLPKSQRLDLW